MAQLVYIDETGSAGRGAAKQPLLTLVGILVDEEKVQPLRESVDRVAWDHLGWRPADFELHGQEIWHGTGVWADKTPPELLAAYTSAIEILEKLELSVTYASIHKANLTARYSGSADDNAYRLALQFLLEKIDRLGGPRRILVADEAKQEQLKAVRMVADMQQWGTGEVPGRTLKTVIDSLHFVQSHASPGVQMADLVAFVLQRGWRNREGHPNAAETLSRLLSSVYARATTWREPWPPDRKGI